MTSIHHPPRLSVAIIGAGLCGLTCAHLLHQSGHSVTVFEKSRGLGGRLATRRMEGGLMFDHGAQYFSARSTEFAAFVEHACSDKSLMKWSPQVQGPIERWDEWRYVGAPTMNAFVKPLADGITVHKETRIVLVENVEGAWFLTSDIGDHFQDFDIVVCAVPAPQAQEILSKLPESAEKLRNVKIAPCWSLMVAFEETLDTSIDAFRDRSGAISWFARNTSKPGRNRDVDCWVAHASPSWSVNHLELDPETAATMMVEMLPSMIASKLPAIKQMSAHRWRYALTTVPLNKPYVSNDSGTLFVGGDWCLGARVEAAFESGRSIAEQIVTEQLEHHGALAADG